MKNLLAFLLLAAGVDGVSQEVGLDSASGPVITFTEKVFEFGEIDQGDVVEHIFSFENTGNTPLILSEVKTTCGCTVPAWPKGKVIAAGEKNEIKVRFNSRGKSGVQSKTITILSNAQNATEKVRILCTVTPPRSDENSGN